LDYNFKSDNTDASLFDRFGRIKTMDLKKMSDDTTIHKYTYVHDANGNRVRADVQQQAAGGGLTNNRDYLYGYDRLNRLIHAERGTLFLDSDISQWKIANSGKGRAWDLDLLGNWSGSPSDNRSVVDYTIWHANDDDQLPGFDAKDTLKALTHHAADATNAITTHTHDDDVQDANPPVDKQFYHDAAGNLVFDGEKFFKYDAWNRVAALYNNDHATNPLSVSNGILSGEPGTVVAQYAYDALGRRIAKTLGTSTSPNEYFYYDGHRVIEHHTDTTGAMEVDKVYVYGLNYIDEPVAYYENNGSGTPSLIPHFILRDANYDVVGIANRFGTLEQQMTLGPYGNYLYIEDGTGTPYNGIDADVSALLIPLGRNALWYDPETGLYYNRARFYDPLIGRLMQRDPNETALALATKLTRNGYAAGLSVSRSMAYSDGLNLYEYVRSNSAGGTDPTGLSPCCGVDITRHLRALWNHVGQMFNKGLNPIDQRILCVRGIMDPVRGWDIDETLFENKYTAFTRGNCGTGNCNGTVTVNGGCYRADDVNYFLWGRINKLCREQGITDPGGKAILGAMHGQTTSGYYFTEREATEATATYRRIKGLTEGGDFRVSERVAWTTSGYKFILGAPTSTRELGCKICPLSYRGKLTWQLGESTLRGVVVGG